MVGTLGNYCTSYLLAALAQMRAWPFLGMGLLPVF